MARLDKRMNSATYAYSTAWTRRLESEIHWRLYWHQQKLIRDLVSPGDSILEIGVGTGFTSNYLRSRGMDVKTLDIDPEKEPDIVANIAHYEFPDVYDAILAFEIFEHIPYEDFRALLPKLAGAARRFVFLSVPRNKRLVASLEIKLPKLRRRTFALKLNRRRIVERFHHWELDHSGLTAASLERELAQVGLEVRQRDEAFARVHYALMPTVRAPASRALPTAAPRRYRGQARTQARVE